MTQRTITRAKVHHTKGPPANPDDFRISKDAKSRMARAYASEGVARCHRCPPASFCSTCNGLNRARIQLGLIRPKQTEDHANNILYAIPIHKRGKIRDVPQRRYGRSCSRLIGGTVVNRSGGWYQGVVSIDGFVIEQGPKMRSSAAAVTWMQTAIATIGDNMAMGIEYEI